MKETSRTIDVEEMGRQVTQCASDLAQFVRGQAAAGTAAHVVEEGIWRRALDLGRWSLKLLFACAGDGDLGEELVLPDGRRVRRLPQLHCRDYHSVFGPVPVPRAVYGSREGQRIEHVPLDARLQLPESKFSYLLQNWDQSLAIEEAFGGVKGILGKILGFGQSVHSLERMNREMAESVPSFFEQLPTPTPENEGSIVVASGDGKGVPMRKPAAGMPIEEHRPKKGPRPDTKKMALLGTVYSVDPLPRTPQEILDSLFRDPKKPPEKKGDRPQPQNKRVRASLARDEEGTTEPAFEEIFGWMAHEIAVRNPGAIKPLCVLMDGQDTLWTQAKRRLPQGNVVEVLDLLHVTPRIWKAAHLFHGEGSSHLIPFVKDRVLRVLEGKVCNVTRWLRWMGDYRGLSDKKKEELAKICNFLDKNSDRMRYDEYLKAGYPIATGVIEGACRHLVKDRLERTGMHWVLQGAQSMLNLRSVHLSGLWDEFTAYRIKRETQRLYPHTGNQDSFPLAAAA